MSAFDDYLNTPAAGNAAPSFDSYLNAPAPVLASAAGGTGAAAPQTAAGQTPGIISSLLTGFGKGLGNTAAGIEQLAGRGASAVGLNTVGNYLNNDANWQLGQIRSGAAPAESAHPFATGVGNVAGMATGTAPLAMMAPEVSATDLAGLGARMGIGGLLGGATGAVTPVDQVNATQGGDDFWSQKAKQVGLSAGLGAAAVPVMSALGSAVRGVTDPIRQRLADAGVTMTPGQILGGAWQRTEDKLTSVPVLGDMIKNAQQRSVQSFNRAAYQSALDPIGAQLPEDVGAGSQGISYVRKQIGNVYDSIVPKANFVSDQNFANDLGQIRNNLAQQAPATLPQFDNIVKNQITGKLQNGALTGQQWNNSRSTIAGIARNRIVGNATPDDRILSDSLEELTDALNAGVGRSSPPDVLQNLQRANAAYAQYKQIERAAGSVGASNQGNVFTAAQYANGVRNGATAFQKATNSGLNGQLATDATNVLGSKYPDSGTVGRSLLTLGLGALAGHSVAPGAVIPGAVGIGMASLPYSTTGQRIAQGLLMNRPDFAGPLGSFIGNRMAPFVPGLLGAAQAASQ